MVITVTAGARLPKAQAAHGDDAGWWGWGVRGKGGGCYQGKISPWAHTLVAFCQEYYYFSCTQAL